MLEKTANLNKIIQKMYDFSKATAKACLFIPILQNGINSRIIVVFRTCWGPIRDRTALVSVCLIVCSPPAGRCTLQLHQVSTFRISPKMSAMRCWLPANTFLVSPDCHPGPAAHRKPLLSFSQHQGLSCPKPWNSSYSSIYVCMLPPISGSSHRGCKASHSQKPLLKV